MMIKSLKPLVLCGPSGSGKSTLLTKLLGEYGEMFGFSISHTTRLPRSGELNGREYHFITREEMESNIKQGEFLEYAEFSGNYYGTSKTSVENVERSGRICILDIDVQGVKQLKKIPELNPRLVFVKPPSIQVLKERLEKRGTENQDSLQKRLDAAEQEILYGTVENFDLVLLNIELEKSYLELKNYLSPLFGLGDN